eukprot:254307-Rhodomonas_salina.1
MFDSAKTLVKGASWENMFVLLPSWLLTVITNPTLPHIPPPTFARTDVVEVHALASQFVAPTLFLMLYPEFPNEEPDNVKLADPVPGRFTCWDRREGPGLSNDSASEVEPTLTPRVIE